MSGVAVQTPLPESNGGGSPWLTPQQVAERLGVSVNKVREYPNLAHPMPIHYPPQNAREWRAYAPEVDAWALATWRSVR